MLTDICLCLTGQNCVTSPLKEGWEIKCLVLRASVVEAARGEAGEKWNLGWPNVRCLPLPGHLKTTTTFNLLVLPILRINS